MQRISGLTEVNKQVIKLNINQNTDSTDTCK